ncbi:MAG: helix-turn-helix domain-containing protein, partial [Porphyrobacter sp.]|nr:helix-turn-helix domain-containing protein [Porphyrobacter sp.]
MSWETQSWAAKQRPGSASAKLVLLGLASCADANHDAHPSVQWLCDFSDLNRKTVIAALDRLGDAGLIADTGDRRGRTGQVKVYRLAAAKAPDASADPASETPVFS